MQAQLSHPPTRFRSTRLVAVTLSAIAACALVISLAGGCDRKPAGTTASKAGSSPEAVSVRLVAVESRAVTRTVDMTGTLFGQEETTIAAKVPGQIISVSADLGDVVQHGGPLAQIDPRDFQLAVEEARAARQAALAQLGLSQLPQGDIDVKSLPVVVRAMAEAANAEARLARAKLLFERTPPLMSQQEFEDIQTQSEVAKAQVNSVELDARAQLAEARVAEASLAVAEKRLADATVLAPGELPLQYRVAERRVSVGEYVVSGSALFRLVATDRVKFRGSLPERYVGQVAPGCSATLHAQGLTSPVQAVVTRVAPAINPASRAFEVELEADNQDGKLKPGAFVRATLRLQREEIAAFVPKTALVESLGSERVLTVKDGKAVEVVVTTGDEQEHMIEVVGLPASMTHVIAEPDRGLAAGTPVQVAP
ncbi:MAG TPA: efflux RND transporter periplasmic adaptor subunit [Phycisphaerales bacterium]|nr:efflux RND transporter periplasmic adaptor subunit [Phycisphaerales bacterium]